MSRYTHFLFAALLLITTLAVSAQQPFHSYDSWEGRVMDRLPVYTPDANWVADLSQNPRYPITVRLNPTGASYDGVSYTGGGTGHIFNPHGEDIAFRYSCGMRFHASEFYARQNKSGSKLTIRLFKPGTQETRSCTIHTYVVTASSGSHP